MLFAKARAAGTLIKILIILFAALALVVFVVLLSVFLRIEYLELDLINEARSGLVKPPKQTFFVCLTQEILPAWQLQNRRFGIDDLFYKNFLPMHLLENPYNFYNLLFVFDSARGSALLHLLPNHPNFLRVYFDPFVGFKNFD